MANERPIPDGWTQEKWAAFLAAWEQRQKPAELREREEAAAEQEKLLEAVRRNVAGRDEWNTDPLQATDAEVTEATTALLTLGEAIRERVKAHMATPEAVLLASQGVPIQIHIENKYLQGPEFVFSSPRIEPVTPLEREGDKVEAYMYLIVKPDDNGVIHDDPDVIDYSFHTSHAGRGQGIYGTMTPTTWSGVVQVQERNGKRVEDPFVIAENPDRRVNPGLGVYAAKQIQALARALYVH